MFLMTERLAKQVVYIVSRWQDIGPARIAQIAYLNWFTVE